MSTYACPDCGELFRVTYLTGTFPGGKEREDIDCPKCGLTVDSEVTSAVLRTVVLTEEERAIYQRSRRS